MRDEANQSKGFGFVCFKDALSARSALQENQETPRGLYVREALSKEQRQAEVERKTLSFKKSMQYMSLHVKGFNPQATRLEDLQEYFGQYGQIKSMKITHTGAALISFTERESARVAKESCNGTYFNGSHLNVSYFEPRELRSLHKLEELDKQASETKKQRDLLQAPLDTSMTSIITAIGAILSMQ
jgi:RNA recognition motif-containing protein